MRVVDLFKRNKMLTIVGGIYLMLFILMPDKATQALGNSSYYLKEMVMILPVIFLLTVSIEVLVPKEVIVKHFGEKSGILGNVLSLVLGSISAGPIYAAFPVSKVLFSKGASVSNIVIILSSWAVVKVPMLANEAKFLGVKFMISRWILTVTAIFIMAWITGKIVDKKDVNTSAVDEKLDDPVSVNQEYCIGCGVCADTLPTLYALVEKKAQVKTSGLNSNNKLAIKKTMEKCPTKAIRINFMELQKI